MKIFLYLKHFPPDGNSLVGGTSKAVYGLAYGLTKAGADVSVIAEGGATERRLSSKKFEILSFADNAKRAPFSISTDLRHFLYSQTDRPDLVVLNGIFHPSVNALASLLYGLHIPYVVAPHAPYSPAMFKRKPILKYMYWHLFERRVLDRAAAVQVLDLRHAHWLRKRGVSTPAIEIANGYSPDDSVLEDEKRGSERAYLSLLFLGRIDIHTKGLDILVRALAMWKRDGAAPFRLKIQGPDWGDKVRLWKYIAAHGLSNHVEIAEPDFSQPSTSLFADADILCLPSRFEGFGLAALEAMISGRVILVSDEAGIAPHVAASGCGVVVQPNEASILRGLRDLFRRRGQWRRMGTQGQAYAVEHLDWRVIGRKALDQYQQLYSKRN